MVRAEAASCRVAVTIGSEYSLMYDAPDRAIRAEGDQRLAVGQERDRQEVIRMAPEDGLLPPGGQVAEHDETVVVRGLAHADPLGPGRCEIKQTGDREPVVHHHLGRPQHLGAAHRQQPGITRTGANQVDGHGRRA